MRYLEPSGLLVVASVTANVRIQTTVGAQFGVGPESTYSGNLVPLSAGVLFEENPTISYTPVEGQAFLRQMLAPLPMDLAVALLSALGDSSTAMTFLVKEVNGIRNPMFADPSAPDEGRRFAEIADLVASLHRRGLLLWTEMAGDEAPFGLLMRRRDTGASQDIARLHDLLGLDPPRELRAFDTVPVVFGVGALEGDAIELLPRSAFDLMQIAAASIDVPAEHLESGLASPLPHGGPNTDQIRIRRSAGPPSDALAAFRHHGWWFWIDGTDGRSKATFRLLRDDLDIAHGRHRDQLQDAGADGSVVAIVLPVPMTPSHTPRRSGDREFGEFLREALGDNRDPRRRRAGCARAGGLTPWVHDESTRRATGATAEGAASNGSPRTRRRNSRPQNEKALRHARRRA
jgi:hypothetical protein